MTNVGDAKFTVDFDENGEVVGVRPAEGAKGVCVTKTEAPGQTDELVEVIRKNEFTKFEVKTTSILNVSRNPICSIVVGRHTYYYVC